jgi:hypothetical protein
MEITVIDKSNYLKGLLITARKDNQLAESEKKIIKEISVKLGFASDFYEDIIKSLLNNKYIKDDPIIFSDKKIAESFIDDGLRLAFSDNKVSDNEINWLRATAKANGISKKWFEEKLRVHKSSPGHPLNSDFALYSII